MAARALVLLTIPGLRQKDLINMPHLLTIAARGDSAPLVPSFPALTCPAQVNMTTGCSPAQHGVVANGYFWREKNQIEMWTAWNQEIQRPQIWEVLKKHDPHLSTAVWFPLLSKGAKADYICTPAPIHNPDGSESLWCYTQPTELYGELRDALGHFPLMNFWGPMANIKSSQWIAESAILAMKKYQPRFFDIYLPHLDYAAQKFGPNAPETIQALHDLDDVIGHLYQEFEHHLHFDLEWLVAGEYAITDVNHVVYPNRVLRDAGMLAVSKQDSLEHLDIPGSQAFAMVDHQIAHLFVKNPSDISAVAKLFQDQPGIDLVLTQDQLSDVGLNHPHAGDVVLISTSNSWFAYYFWNDDQLAPPYARTVDIHRKPGYDPVELYIDLPSRTIPLNADLVKGSHGALVKQDSQKSVIISTSARKIAKSSHKDTEIFSLILNSFGISSPQA